MMKQFTNGFGFLMKTWDKYVIVAKNALEKILSYLSRLELRPYTKEQLESLKYLIFILALALLLYVVFHNPIESFISIFLVNPIFSQIDYGPWTSLAIVFLVGLYLFGVFKWLNVAITSTAFLLFLAFIYIHYRNTSDVWIFTTFLLVKWLNYVDIIFLFVITTNLCCLIVQRKPKPLAENGPASFISDEPIEDDGKDVLGYPAYAKMIAEKILISHFKKTFAIGITGKWGLGKTTFLNYLKNNLETNNTIIIDFNPWNSQNPSAIIKDFFETVRNNKKLKQNNSSLSRSLLKYSESLLSLNENYGTRLMQVVISDITESKPISQLFKLIKDDIERLNKKLIIFIDDLDRLDSDEIVEVLRLIRNTANFPNTFFIVGYDRNYVITALSLQNAYSHEEYLEKIFQLELTLPYFKKNVLREKLLESIKLNSKKLNPDVLHSDVLNSKFRNELLFEISDAYLMYNNYLDSWLESIRDVTRLSNAINLNIGSVVGEVVLGEFIRLEILRLKYPSVYELIHRRAHDFLDLSASEDKNRYELKLSKSQNTKKNKNSPVSAYYLGKYLLDNHLKISVPKQNIKKILDLVASIFLNSNSINPYSQHHLSVIYPSNFECYFAYCMPSGSLSEIEFSNARASGTAKFNEKIIEWVSQGQRLQDELRSRFIIIKSFDNREDFEKVIRAIFCFVNSPKTHQNDAKGNILQYNPEDIWDKLNDLDGKLSHGLYKEHSGQEGLATFTQSLFDAATVPFTFESKLIDHITGVSPQVNKFPLQPPKLIEIAAKHLVKFVEFHQNTKNFDDKIYPILKSCKNKVWSDTGDENLRKETLTDEAKEIFKDFIVKDLDGFLLSAIYSEPLKQTSFAIEPIILDVWNTWEKFEEYLEGIEEKSECHSDFLNLFKVFKAKDFKVYVLFEFQVIPVAKISPGRKT